MAEVASAYVSLMPSAKGFGSALEGQVGGEVKKSGSKIGGFLGGALKKGALGVTAAAGGILGTALFSGFKRLNAIDQAKAKLTGLGNSTKTVNTIMDNALSSVKGTAFGLDEAATTAAGAVAAGIKPGKQLTGVLKTVADTATIAGTSMSDMGTIFGSVAARGKLQGDDLMQLQSRGVPVLAFLAKHYHTTAAAASKMVSAGEVDFKNFASAMKAGLGGAALASGKTFSGAFANLKASLSRIGANLLSGIFPLVHDGMVKLTEVLGPVEDFATKIGAKIPGLFSKIGSAIKGAFGGGAGGGIVSTLKSIGSALGSQFGPVVQAVGKYLSALGSTALQLAGYLRAKLGPIFAQIGDIIANNVVPIVSSLVQFLYGKLVPAIIKIVTAVAGKLKPVFDALVQVFKADLLPAIQGILSKFQAALPTLQKVGLFILKVVGFVLKLAAAILGKALPPLIKFIGFLIKLAGGIIGGLITVIGGLIKGFVNIGKAGQKLWGVLKAAFRFIVDAFLGVASAIIHGAAKAFGWVPGIGGKLKGAAKSFDRFRADVNRSLDGIHNTVKIDADTSQARAAINGLQTYINSLHGRTGTNALRIESYYAKRGAMPRAGGGPVSAGSTYLVGEVGPELFVPNVSGRIVSHADLKSSSGTPVAATLGSGASTVRLIVDDMEFTAYVEAVADDRIDAHGNLEGMGARAGAR